MTDTPKSRPARKEKLQLPDPRELSAVLDVLMIHGVRSATIGDLTVEFNDYVVTEKAAE